MAGYIPTTRADSLELFIGSCAVGRARAGNHTLDLLSFFQLPGQPAAVGLTAADVGCPVAICGGGAVDPDMPPAYFVQGAMFHTTIAAVTDAATCTLTDAPITGIYNTGFYTVIVYRRALMQLDTVEYDSSITPGTRDTLKFTVLGMLSGGALNPYIERFTTICNGQPVYLRSTDSEVGEIFGGYIDTLTVQNYPGYPGIYEWDCTCASWAGLAMRRQVPPYLPTTFDGVAGDAVFRKLVLWMCKDDSVSVSAAAAPEIVLQAPAGANVGQLLDQVVSLISTSTVGWYWTVDPWRCFVLAINTATAAPWNVTDGYDLLAGNQPDQVSIETTHNQLANFVYGLGSSVLLNALNATIKGDGTSRTFNLPQEVGAPPTITLNGSPQTVGVLGVDTGQNWYWAQGSTTITQDSGGTILTTSDTLLVVYEVPTPAVAQAPNVASLQGLQGIEGTSAEYDYSFSVTAPIYPQDLLDLATGYETTYGEPAQTVTAGTLRPGLKTGQIQSITFPRAGISGSFLIASIKMTTFNNIIRWDYTAFGGANIGNAVTGLVQFINRGGGSLELTTPTQVIEASGTTPKQVALAYSTSGSTNTATLPDPVNVGDLLIAVCVGGPSAEFSGPTFNLSDSLGNVWAQIAYVQQSTLFYPSGSAIWIAQVGTAGACTVTCTVTTEAVHQTSFVVMVAPTGVSAVDVFGTTNSATPNPTITTTQDGDFIVTGGAPCAATPAVSGVESIAAFGLQATSIIGVAAAYGVQATAGAFTSSLNMGETGGFVCSVAFKAAAPGPPAQTTNVVVNPVGTVTHTIGALTSGEPIIGHGGGDVTVGTKTGDTAQFVTATGSPATGAPLVYWSSGDAMAGSVGQLVPAGGTAGQVLEKASGTDYDTRWATAGTAKPTVHTEPLTDGDSNFIFAAGDILVVIWIPN